MFKFEKPNGTVVEVNETSYKYALALGWKEAKNTPKTKAKKRGNSSDSN
jgi:hypothetical protein